MRKLLPLAALMCLLPGLASAAPQPVSSGYLEVAHGWVKRPDGSLVSIKGMMVPYKVWPISAKKIDVKLARRSTVGALKFHLENPRFTPSTKGSPKSAGPEADLVIYNADIGIPDQYGAVPDNPSSLDDITLSGGLGKPWQSMKFGFSTTLGLNPRFLIRWKIWETNVDNGVGLDDFNTLLADFGVIWNVAIPNDQVIVEIGIAQAGMSTSDSTLFMAQQFREVSNPPTPIQLQGEGEFLYGSVDTVFNNNAPPSVGSSDGAVWWYDWNDGNPDGVYENTEMDIVDTGLSNHVLGIKVAGTGSVFSFPISSITPIIGLNPTGNFISTFQSFDNNQYLIKPFHGGARLDPIARVEMKAFAAFGNVIGIRASGLTTSTLGGLTRVVEMKRVTNNSWVTLSSQVVGQGASNFSESYGGVVPMSEFIGGGEVTFRISWFVSGTNTSRTWDMGIDMFSVTYNLN